MRTNGLVIIAIFFTTLIHWNVVHAENTEWRQGTNAMILPQYCQDRLDKNGAWQNWRNYFGSVFIHMHHYCGGVYAELKAQTSVDRRKRDKWVHEAIVQMNYVSPHCDPSCVVYADLHRRWAWALMLQGKTAEAMEHTRLMQKAGPSQLPK